MIPSFFRYVKQLISLAPNNGSAWNYLRGVLDHNKLPYSRLVDFVTPYTVPLNETANDVVDLENPPPTKGADLPCTAAIEFLADIYEEKGGESIVEATEVCGLIVDVALLLDQVLQLWKSLANEHDAIRKK